MSEGNELMLLSESESASMTVVRNCDASNKHKKNDEEHNLTQKSTKIVEKTNITDEKSIQNGDKMGEYNDVIQELLSDIVENVAEDQRPMSSTELLDCILNVDEFNEKSIREKLKNIIETQLLAALKEIEQINSYLLKENEVYEFALSEDETMQSLVDSQDVEEDMSAQDSLILTYPAKCYFAKKKIGYTEKELGLKNSVYTDEIQNLNFEFESLNISLKDLNTSRENFNKNIRIGGRHPVTKKIVLQKVMKYFDDSIRTKMALTNRYKVQIQGDIMERNKILSQIEAQQKRLALLDVTEFQEAQFEHKKTQRQLRIHKEQLGKFKAKFSLLLQKLAKMKKDLKREQNDMEQMKHSVSKLEHLKEVMLTEKFRNDQNVSELKTAMRKIKLDPRRHNLPEVIEYAASKRENVILQKELDKWKKKVEAVQQEKMLYLNALSKKEKY